MATKKQRTRKGSSAGNGAGGGEFQKALRQRFDGKPSVPRASGYDLDAVVKEIAEKMSRCEWVCPTSHYEYMDRYGVKLDAVQAWAAQASRHLRLVAGEDPENIRARIIAGIEHGARVALAKTRQFATVKGDVIEYADPDVRSHLHAHELLAKAYGVLVEKHEHKVNLGEWTEEQLLEELRKAGYDVSKREPEGGDDGDAT